MKRFWSHIRTDITTSSWNYNGYLETRFTKRFRATKWPLISWFWWQFTEPTEVEVFGDHIPFEAQFNGNVFDLHVGGENLKDWLLENCRNGFFYRESFSVIEPNQVAVNAMLSTNHGELKVLFLNRKDATLFKLRFG